MPKTITQPKSERTPEEIAALDIPEAAIEQPEDDSVCRIIADHIKPTLTGLVITGELSCEDWLKAAEFYQFLRSRTQWIIGDILRYGEYRYGEKYAQAVDDHGKSSSRLSTYVYVCNRFEIERRRPELSFDHHAECAALDPREADRVLLEAIKMRWTKQDVREEVARINERNGVPRRGRKPGSVSAKLAASGKQPQVPEGEKALLWDAKPLSVMITAGGARVVCLGGAPLGEVNTEEAAKKHKFAHGPALAAWLEEHNFIKERGDEPCAPAADSLTQASASNGAAPNATESAPTPQIGPDMMLASGAVATWDGKPVYAKDGLLWVEDRWLNAPEADQCANAHGFRYAEQMVKALEKVSTAAPAAPPAWPEPAAVAKEHQEQLWELQRVCDALRSDARLFQKQRDGFTADLQVANDLLTKQRKHVSELETKIAALAPSESLMPLQRAETSILAFNAASEEVDWKAVGQDKLLRAKWLSRLLARADICIDLIQNNPPAPRSEKP